VEELGLFPLGIVLLPTERVPLHIFEPRYQELIGECLETGRDFGLLLVDEDGLKRVGTRASVVTVIERFDDGRLNILVEGRDRFVLRGLTSGTRSFHTANVVPFVDDAASPTDEDADAALRAFRRLAGVAEAEAEEPERGSGLLSFELAARVELPVERKQQLLELRAEGERLRLVAGLFDEAAEAILVTKALQARAARNGTRHS
jgi:Lon protease-like protein